MKDKNRIKVITQKIAELWSYVPDWRFMQLFCNFLASPSDRLNFYEEDDELEKRLDFLIGRLKDKGKM